MSSHGLHHRQISVIATYFAITACAVSITISPAASTIQVVPLDALRVPPFEDPFRPPIPSFAMKIDGQRIRIRGYITGNSRATGGTEYLFSPETKFRPPWSERDYIPPHGLIPVFPAADWAELHTLGPVTVEGLFRICIQSDAYGISGVYQIEDARVVEKNVHGLYPPVVPAYFYL